MKGRDLYSAMSGIDDQFLAIADAPNKEEHSMKKHVKMRRLLIAAALVSLLGVTAFAVTSKIQLQTTRYAQNTGETVEPNASTAYEAEIGFQSTAEEYEGLQSYRPTWVPDGYQLCFVSGKAYGYQILQYATASDECALEMEVTRGGQGHEIIIESVSKEEDVQVGNLPGRLYTATNGGRVLTWVDEEKGLGFMLRTMDAEVDLTHVAESVQPDPELEPTNADRYRMALEELGDYQITGLPENYPETEFVASPKEDGGGSYAYVRRWYIDAKQNDTVFLMYETFSLDTVGDERWDPVENTPETVLAMNGGGEPTTVQGMPAAIADGQIVWVDWDKQVVFMITADSMDAAQLQNLADSVQLADNGK